LGECSFHSFFLKAFSWRSELEYRPDFCFFDLAVLYRIYIVFIFFGSIFLVRDIFARFSTKATVSYHLSRPMLCSLLLCGGDLLYDHFRDNNAVVRLVKAQ